MRPSYVDIIDQLDLPQVLAEFDPIVIGTPPLGIATARSDIDIACFASDFGRFDRAVRRAFGEMQAFSIRTADHLPDLATVASFFACGWEIEIFCQEIETEKQWGVRHFRVEERLLALQPRLRQQISCLKQGGMKTEPAFARILGLAGDPYEAILQLEDLSDAQLVDLLDAAG
ncbi:DUF4269 domain-containing protein [Roseibium sp.]|uniref:DUF4269 domain-containing protein n=1 Tax=Roseibium sp. TaxID=1936156 RepID=UPI003BAD9029